MGNQNEKQKLFHIINLVSFMLNDIVLYLDTHPKDSDALQHFEHFSKLRNQSLKEYSEHFGPLTIDTVSPGQEWLWATQPWPWEGGYC